jgi:hypothetical protein
MSTLTAAPSTFAAAWMVITRDWFSKTGKSKDSHSESAAELLRRAEVYASTQPGYAADLRAAAQRVIDQG